MTHTVGCATGMLVRQHGQKLKLKKDNCFQARAKQTPIKRQLEKSEQESDAFSLFFSVVAGPVWSQQPWGIGSQPKARWLNTELLVPLGNFSQWCKFVQEQRTVTFLSIGKRNILKVGFFCKWLLAKKTEEIWQENQDWFPIMKSKGSICDRKVCGKGSTVFQDPPR